MAGVARRERAAVRLDTECRTGRTLRTNREGCGTHGDAAARLLGPCAEVWPEGNAAHEEGSFAALRMTNGGGGKDGARALRSG